MNDLINFKVLQVKRYVRAINLHPDNGRLRQQLRLEQQKLFRLMRQESRE